MEWVSVSKAAKIMNCTATQIYRLMDAGFLEGIRIDARRYVNADVLEHFIRTHQHNGQLDTSIEFAKIIKYSKNP